MPVTTPHVGVRTFLNTLEKQPLIVADMSTIGGVFTAPNCDRTKFPIDTPVHFTTDDTDMIAAVGATGTLRQTVEDITNAGIIASLVAVVPNLTGGMTTAQQIAAMAGSSSSQTGAWALPFAQAETGAEPDILICPGFTSQRIGGSANAVATAFDAVCDRITTAISVCNTPSTNKTDSVEWAADFAETMNIITCAQGARVTDPVSGNPVVRDSSAAIAALIAKTDKEKGGPYYNPGNRTLKGILGPSRSVGFRIDDPDCEANFLLQRGVNSIVQLEKNRTSRASNAPQGKTFWGFWNTCNDPLWRAINVVRTRKAVREVIPRTLVKYAGRNLGAHLVATIIQALDDFLGELKRLPEPAILGGEVKWERALNSNAAMRTGSLAVTLNFEEAPALTDLQVWTGRHEASFNILASEIEAAMRQYNVSGQLA